MLRKNHLLPALPVRAVHDDFAIVHTTEHDIYPPVLPNPEKSARPTPLTTGFGQMTFNLCAKIIS